jgi:long-chain acyl-CoA synthetase
MLVVPNLQTLTSWAEGQGIKAADTEALLALPEVQSKMDREVRTTLRDLASFEVPKRLLLLPRDFSLESGELTPTLKIKRRIVEQRYRAAIEELYSEG